MLSAASPGWSFGLFFGGGKQVAEDAILWKAWHPIRLRTSRFKRRRRHHLEKGLEERRLGCLVRSLVAAFHGVARVSVPGCRWASKWRLCLGDRIATPLSPSEPVRTNLLQKCKMANA